MHKNGKRLSPDTPLATLRTVADHVGLAPCSVSAVLNNTAAAQAIPHRTRERVRKAARLLNYRPNLAARALRTRRTHTVALIAADLGNARVARIVAGVESFVRAQGYLLMITADGRAGSSERSTQFLQHGIEGVITIDSTPPKSVALPMVFIDLPSCDLPEPVTPLKRERLAAMGEAAAQSLLAQLEQKTGYLTRVALAPEPMTGLMPADTAVSVHRLPPLGQFAD